MKIESMRANKDGYKFKINNAIILEISGTAISVLGIDLSYSSNIKEYYKNIRKQLDLEKMMNDLLNKKSEINRVFIDSKICYVDDNVIFQTEDLVKYKR